VNVNHDDGVSAAAAIAASLQGANVNVNDDDGVSASVGTTEYGPPIYGDGRPPWAIYR
jgi:hypothetical protein